MATSAGTILLGSSLEWPTSNIRPAPIKASRQFWIVFEQYVKSTVASEASYSLDKPCFTWQQVVKEMPEFAKSHPVTVPPIVFTEIKCKQIWRDIQTDKHVERPEAVVWTESHTQTLHGIVKMYDTCVPPERDWFTITLIFREKMGEDWTFMECIHHWLDSSGPPTKTPVSSRSVNSFSQQFKKIVNILDWKETVLKANELISEYPISPWEIVLTELDCKFLANDAFRLNRSHVVIPWETESKLLLRVIRDRISLYANKTIWPYIALFMRRLTQCGIYTAFYCEQGWKAQNVTPVSGAARLNWNNMDWDIKLITLSKESNQGSLLSNMIEAFPGVFENATEGALGNRLKKLQQRNSKNRKIREAAKETSVAKRAHVLPESLPSLSQSLFIGAEEACTPVPQQVSFLLPDAPSSAVRALSPFPWASSPSFDAPSSSTPAFPVSYLEADCDPSDWVKSCLSKPLPQSNAEDILELD